MGETTWAVVGGAKPEAEGVIHGETFEEIAVGGKNGHRHAGDFGQVIEEITRNLVKAFEDVGGAAGEVNTMHFKIFKIKRCFKPRHASSAPTLLIPANMPSSSQPRIQGRRSDNLADAHRR